MRRRKKIVICLKKKKQISAKLYKNAFAFIYEYVCVDVEIRGNDCNKK